MRKIAKPNRKFEDTKNLEKLKVTKPNRRFAHPKNLEMHANRSKKFEICPKHKIANPIRKFEEPKNYKLCRSEKCESDSKIR